MSDDCNDNNKSIGFEDIDPEQIELQDDPTKVDRSKLHQMKAEVREYQLDELLKTQRPEKHFWKKTRVGRFLSGRTKAGRIFRRVGIGVLSVGASSVGLDLSPVLQTGGSEAAGGGSTLQTFMMIREILLIVGSILFGLTKSCDVAETYLEKINEQEAFDGKRRWITTIFRTITKRLL